MSHEAEIFDLRQVSCGLVPAMSTKLGEVKTDVVEFHIKQGIKLEITSSFGTDPVWKLEFENHIGMDVARFIRRNETDPASRLNIVDY